MRVGKIVICALACLQLPSAGVAKSGQPLFAPESMRADLEFLADDLLDGRGPGTPGFDIAAAYVAAQFRAIGLQPAVAGSWYQPVPLVERMPNVLPGAHVTIGASDFAFGEHALSLISGEGAQRWSGEAVFIGYGLVGSVDMDAYQRVDVRGKAVVMFDGAPKSLSSEAARALTRRRAEDAFARGAAGIVTLVDTAKGSAPSWEEFRADFKLPFFNWLQPDGTPFRTVPMRFSALLDPTAADQLFASEETSFGDLRERAGRGEALPSFALKQQIVIEGFNRWRRFESENVLGIVRGSDPSVAGEYVLVTAHLDHLGKDPNSKGDDKIFNGAMDNGSGIAAMIEMARAAAQGDTRPRRPVMFAAVTAEEIGLLGSDYLAEHPLPGGGKVVAVINIDGGIPILGLEEVSAYGGTHSTIGAIAAAVAASSGVRAVPDKLAPDEYFERTDSFSFARRGVPAIYLVMGSTKAGEELYGPHLHQPSDDLKLPFNWADGARFARLAHEVVLAVANSAQTPRWCDGSLVADRFDPRGPRADCAAGQR